MILEASCQVERLHLFVCSETARDLALFRKSHFRTFPSPEIRTAWVERLTAPIGNIIVHHLNEDGLPSYPNGWEAWSDRAKEQLNEKGITPTIIFSSEPQDKAPYEQFFKIPVKLVDPDRNLFPISATKVREAPYQHWQFIPRIIQPSFTKRILLLGADKRWIEALTLLYQTEAIALDTLLKSPHSTTEPLLFVTTSKKIVADSLIEEGEISAIIDLSLERRERIEQRTRPYFRALEGSREENFRYLVEAIGQLLAPKSSDP